MIFSTSRWFRDLWSKGVLLILAYFQTFLSFCIQDGFSVFQKNRVLGYSLSNKTWWKPRFPMDQRPLVEGCIPNFVIFLDVSEFLCFGDFFRLSKKSGFWVFLVHPPMASVLLSASIKRFFYVMTNLIEVYVNLEGHMNRNHSSITKDLPAKIINENDKLTSLHKRIHLKNIILII